MQENPIPLEPLKTETLVDFFVQCGAVCFAVLTILLVLLLYSAWKFPMHMRNIGRISLVASFFFSLIALYQMCRNFTYYGFMPVALWSGLRFVVVPLIYGLAIHTVALILDILLGREPSKKTRK